LNARSSIGEVVVIADAKDKRHSVWDMSTDVREELLVIERELMALDSAEKETKNRFGVELRGSGLHVHRDFHISESWDHTAASIQNPNEDTTRFDALIASAARIAGLTGDGTPRDKFLNGLRAYLLNDGNRNFIEDFTAHRFYKPAHEEHIHPASYVVGIMIKIRRSCEIYRLPYVAANYVLFLANQELKQAAEEPKEVFPAKPVASASSTEISYAHAAIDELKGAFAQQIQPLIDNQKEFREDLADVKEQLPRRQHRPTAPITGASPEERIIIDAIKKGLEGKKYGQFLDANDMTVNPKWQQDWEDQDKRNVGKKFTFGVALKDTYWQEKIQSRKSYVARKFDLPTKRRRRTSTTESESVKA
jgi:hypothetical protein